ncbi:AGE family epimerase/isomerase [Ruminococcaceae bacterium OttesenSCG-928-D13]|nr:AGE family epimerase/isomerase [Ruminococcaceae bacterium OttesenSCG-928-D13]
MVDEGVLGQIHGQVKAELSTCVNFWLRNGQDTENGGVYTCLDETGRVFSTDKSVWMQGRCAWTFSRLCNLYGRQPGWQAFAKSCLDFLEAYCINRKANGRMYFTVTADGQPLRQRRYHFSECFYTMANAEYYALTGGRDYLDRARSAWEMIWQLDQGLVPDPTGLAPKADPATRRGRALANPMIYLNLCSVLEGCDPDNAVIYRARAKTCAQTILTLHHRPELKATLEMVGENGEFWAQVAEGRVVNPGHDMECAWFLLEHALALGDEKTADKAVEMFDFAYNNGWDDAYGGLLYYTDVLGHPPEAYEHDMKLWWPHNELLIAALMIYRYTGREKYLRIFIKAWEYAMGAFREPVHGEWYGYLHRDGKPTLPAAKGSTFKGPFHLPRMLMKLDGMLGSERCALELDNRV